MGISIFSPIIACPHTCPENLSALRFTTSFFNFGQTSYRIDYVHDLNRNNSLQLVQVDAKPAWYGVCVRVIALFTVIIPLLMMIGACVYTLANRFVKKEKTDPKTVMFSDLPAEIQKIIFKKVIVDAESLSQVDKAIHSCYKDDPDLTINRMASFAIDEAVKIIDLLPKHEVSRSCCQLAKVVAQIDQDKAVAILLNAAKKLNESKNLKLIVKLLTRYNNIEEAMKIANQFIFDAKSLLMSIIAVEIASTDPAKAKDIISSLNDCCHETLKNIAIATAKIDIDRGIALAETLNKLDRTREDALSAILKMVAPNDPVKAKKIVAMVPEDYRATVLKLIQYYYAKHDRQKAIQLTARLGVKGDAYQAIVKEWIKVDFDEAKEWVAGLNTVYKFLPLAEIIKVLFRTDPENAKKLIKTKMANYAVIWGNVERRENKYRVMLVELMAALDIDEAYKLAQFEIKGEALSQIAKVLLTKDKNRAIEIADEALRLGWGLKSLSQRFETFLSVVKAII